MTKDEEMKRLVNYDQRMNVLAKDRTLLANERTMLAYVRTGFSAIILGVGLIKLFEQGVTFYLGVANLIIGLCILTTGLFRYAWVGKLIRKR